MIDKTQRHRIRITRLLEDGSEVPFDDEKWDKPIDCNGFVVVGMTAKGENMMDCRSAIHNCGINEIASIMKTSDELNNASRLLQLNAIADALSLAGGVH